MSYREVTWFIFNIHTRKVGSSGIHATQMVSTVNPPHSEAHIVVSLTLRHELMIDKRDLVKEDQKTCTLVKTNHSYVYIKNSILRLQTHNFKN